MKSAKHTHSLSCGGLEMWELISLLLNRMNDAQSRPRREYTPKPKPIFDFAEDNHSNGGYPSSMALPPSRNSGRKQLLGSSVIFDVTNEDETKAPVYAAFFKAGSVRLFPVSPSVCIYGGRLGSQIRFASDLPLEVISKLHQKRAGVGVNG